MSEVEEENYTCRIERWSTAPGAPEITDPDVIDFLAECRKIEEKREQKIRIIFLSILFIGVLLIVAEGLCK